MLARYGAPGAQLPERTSDRPSSSGGKERTNAQDHRSISARGTHNCLSSSCLPVRLPKAERKRRQIEKAPRISRPAQLVKLADKIYQQGVSMKFLATIVVICALGLTGCATRMQAVEDQKPIAVSAAATKKLVLAMDGSEVAKGSDSWGSLTSAFHDGCKEEASSAGVPIEFQHGAAHATGEEGTLFSMYVNDFRYVSTGARIGFGIMTGNAFIDASTKFQDLKSGDVWGERPYSTKSSAWQGIMSAMTAKQAQTICKNMIDVLRNTEGDPKKK